jgi:preprotein translocase subunit YajC
VVSALAQQQQQPWWFTMGPLAFIVLIFYFVMIRPQVKQQREHQNLIDKLKKGDKVITSGGIWGVVESVEAHAVCLKVGDKTKLMVTRSHISGFQPKPGEPAETK